MRMHSEGHAKSPAFPGLPAPAPGNIYQASTRGQELPGGDLDLRGGNPFPFTTSK